MQPTTMLRISEIASNIRATSNLIHNDNAPIKGIRAQAGAASAPSMSFVSDSDTGIFNPGPNIVGIVAGSNMAIMASPSNIVTQKQMVISSNIIPADNAVQYIGTSNLHFKEAWIDTIHISQNTLYLGDTPVLGTESDSIAIRADTDQSINVKTTGLGVTNLVSTKGVNVAVTGLNSVVDIQSSGAGGRVVMGASNEISLNAPTATIESNLTVKGNLTVNGTQFTANVQTVEIKDNILLVNKGQIGSGVSAGYAGIRVDRGDLVDYDLVFNETTDKFEIGPVGSLVPIATETYVTNAVASVSATEGSAFSSNASVYASNVANTALPKAGGTLTGPLLATSNAQLRTSAFAGENNQHQFVVGTSNLQGKIGFLYDTQTETGYIQSMKQGVGGRPLRLNFAGGDVSVGRSNASANLEINGTITTTSLSGTCISSSVSSTSNNVAASSAAVKSAYDIASNANVTASNALPKSGGTLTGALTGTSASFTSLSGTAISDSVSSTSNNVAASSAAVKAAYDRAGAATITSIDASNITSGILPVTRGGTGVGTSTGTGSVVLQSNASLIGNTDITYLNVSSNMIGPARFRLKPDTLIDRSIYFDGPLGTYSEILATTVHDIVFKTDSNPGTYVPRMTIKANGNVGINTQTPSTMLDVNGTLNVAGALTGTSASFTSLSGTAISNSVTSTSNNVAASSAAVKSAYDIASIANTTASNALPKAGGTLTGALTGTSALFTTDGAYPADGLLAIEKGGGKIMLRREQGNILDTEIGSYSRNSLRIDAGQIFSHSNVGVNYPDASNSPYSSGITIDAGGSKNALQIVASNTGVPLCINTARKGDVLIGSNLTVYGVLTAPSLAGTCISSSVSSTSNNVAASSAAVKSAYDIASNALPKSGGTLTGIIVSTSDNLVRHVYGNTGVIYQNDGTDMYILKTATNDAYGSYDATRPFRMNFQNGDIMLGQNLGVGLAVSPTERLEVNGNIKVSSTLKLGSWNFGNDKKISFNANNSGTTADIWYEDYGANSSSGFRFKSATQTVADIWFRHDGTIISPAVSSADITTYRIKGSPRIVSPIHIIQNKDVPGDDESIVVTHVNGFESFISSTRHTITGGDNTIVPSIPSNLKSLKINASTLRLNECVGAGNIEIGNSGNAVTFYTPNFHIRSTTMPTLTLTFNNVASYRFNINEAGQLYLHRYDNGTVVGNSSFSFSGIFNAVSTGTYSDDRLKSNENFINDATSTLNKLRPQIYDKWLSMDYSTNSNASFVKESGLIAQEIFYDAPELRHLINMSSDANSNIIYNETITSSDDPSIDPDYSTWGSDAASVNYVGLIPYLIKAVQEKDTQISTLIDRITVLEQKVQ